MYIQQQGLSYGVLHFIKSKTPPLMDRYFMSHYNRKDLGLTLWHVIKFKIYFGLRDIKGENKHVQGHVV